MNRLIISTIGLLVLAGCGAAPSGEAPISNPVLVSPVAQPIPAPALTTSFIRVRQPGDFWSYNEQRKIVGFDNQAFNLVGTLTSTVLAATITDFYGNEAGVTSLSLVLRNPGEDGVLTSIAQAYITQDPDGTMYVHGLLDDSIQPPIQRFVTVSTSGKAVSFPSPIELGSVTQTAFIEYDDGTTETFSAVAVKVENIHVPAGEYVAMRIESSGTRITGSQTMTTVATSWLVPELGAAVKLEQSTTIRDDTTGEVMAVESVSEMTETNISL